MLSLQVEGAGQKVPRPYHNDRRDTDLTAARYRAMLDWLRARPALCRLIHFLAIGSVVCIYVLYAGLLGWLAWNRDMQFWQVLLVTCAVFVSGTVLRAVINRPRPYTALGFAPLFPKNTVGKSMPSRHSFSAAVIAAAAWAVWPPLGAAGAVFALLIALTRVLSGVHSPSDVLVGLAFGGLAGLAGMYLF